VKNRKNRGRRAFFGVFALCLMASVVFGACAKKAVLPKIMIYTSMYEDVIEQMKVALKSAFPGYNIEFFYGGTGALQAKIAAEKDAGKIGCDILMVSEPSYALELMDYGMLHPYLSKEAAALDFPYDPQGYWYPVRICNMVLAYNPEKISKDQLPNSFKDFAYDARVKGSVSMSNPLTSGTAMASVSAFKDKYGYEYFTALGNQGVMVESGSVALTKLETGECKIIQILEESVLKKRQEEQSKLEVIYPTDGTVIIPSIIASLNDQWSANKNTAAAEEITDWFLSPAGQANVVKGWMHSVRKNFPTLPYDSIPTAEIKANSMPVDWEHCYRQREEIRTKFEEAVTAKK
jgi:iron(III) transport system substrate-binding protein